MNEENKLLTQKNKALENQLGKMNDDFLSLQEAATNLKNQLDEKKHSEQMGAWAIDRALETAKINKELGTSTDIIAVAETYTAWIMKTAAKPIEPQSETVN